MKKKILALAIAAIMVVTAIASVSLAYLQDTDYDKNTMTVGNVKIEQTEWERTFNDSGVFSGFQEYQQDKKLVPAVYTRMEANWKVPYAYTGATVGETQLDIIGADGTAAWNGFWGNDKQGHEWNGSNPANTFNAQDKIVVVKNTGSESCYYRTIILVEAISEDGEDVWLNVNGNTRFVWNNNGQVDPIFYVTIGEVKYSAYVATYQEVLAPDQVSRPSLLQVLLDKKLTNEDMVKFGDKVDIHVLSQAVQSAGFETFGANDALNEAFGEVTEANVIAWFTSAN